MKNIAFICLIFFSACADDQELSEAESTWKMLWHIDSEMIEGKLSLFSGDLAQLKIPGGSEILGVKDRECIDYRIRKSDNRLILRRLDNNVELHYTIVKEDAQYMDLIFAEGVTVQLYRQ